MKQNRVDRIMAALKEMGYTVLRYANSDIHGNFEGVCADILNHLPKNAVFQE